MQYSFALSTNSLHPRCYVLWNDWNVVFVGKFPQVSNIELPWDQFKPQFSTNATFAKTNITPCISIKCIPIIPHFCVLSEVVCVES